MMLKTISVRVDDQLKKESTMMLSDIGMSTSQFIKMALKQLVRQGRLPFNQESYEADVDFSDETTESYIEAVKHKDTKTFADYDSLERELNK